MEPNIYQLALAALFGASFVAVSGFFMHFKALNLVLERGKERKENPDGDEPQNPTLVRRRSQVRRKVNDQYGRSPASLPDATPFTDGGGGGGGDTGRSNGHVYVDEIPPGLPRLHTPSEGRASVHGASSIRKTGSFVRPISPKSPVASASAFESVEESDDDDNLTNSEGLDASYLQANGDNEMPADANEEQISMAASSMIRSHSVSGDLHGVQPDPIAADILRKEPEQETFVRLNVPLEVPTSDEVEAYKCLQECLELRKRYVFQETVAPWEKEVISDPSTPKPNTEPFAHYPQGKSDHCFEMQDGVVHVFANKDAKEDLFPVADATAFFTDLHHVLKVIAAGNIRTLCHRRLVLLEQARVLFREE
nr:AMP deaminase like protein [Arabidopsis thaliana]